MTHTDVSVVMPVLNAAPYLAEALASIHAQRMPVREIIVVDDGSTDGSLEIAREHADRVLQSSGRCGPSHCRNLGVASAGGLLLAFLDADDRWLPDHTERALAALRAGGEAELSFAEVRAFGADSYVTDAGAMVPPERAFDARIALLERNVVPQITVVVTRRAFDAAGGYDERLRYSEDFDLWHRLARIVRFVHVPRVTAEYRVHDAQASRDYSRLARSAWQIRLRELPDLLAVEGDASRRAAEIITRSWDQESAWAVKVGDRSSFDALRECYALVRQTLVSAGHVPPAERQWSTLRAAYYAARRMAKALIQR